MFLFDTVALCVSVRLSGIALGFSSVQRFCVFSSNLGYMLVSVLHRGSMRFQVDFTQDTPNVGLLQEIGKSGHPSGFPERSLYVRTPKPASPA